MGQETIRTLLSAISGAVITGIFGVWLQRLKNQGSNEGVYADHTNDLFERLDRITNERDDLKEQVIELKAQVQKLNSVIDSLNKQMGSLTSQVSKFTEQEEEK
ncbi:hypothetical protein [Companilactobacillus bobalius]|uniref:DUF2746 domain-containing protein n=2 Tax=Companilactobacillus bobalius TaxID=2801451 RepID=A0A202F7V4_9LACO|nr:hypothetical protein [Companilactobacillus bobalius]GEO58464.1 hypothetical protein LBO01_15930 [Companilactobacillus paralimentarius]KAE9557586.1 hypothetical protein ATN92_15655 [Companilactobacillus bobalius]KAE9563732.1 hypothetical protein ATN92_03105 [Companilactobacillus bobalius]KRK83478.1 hypothetical protein FC78_GL001434 [Companilactobacillus bobalius DSM 19674]OVE96561.1 hypothetical protein LKACC16343_02230 [Companilactobacillus bobalius]